MFLAKRTVTNGTDTKDIFLYPSRRPVRTTDVGFDLPIPIRTDNGWVDLVEVIR
jgi:hypothetical protein